MYRLIFAYHYNHLDVFVWHNALCTENVGFCGSGERILYFLLTQFKTAQ